jgi:hypothetical protein
MSKKDGMRGGLADTSKLKPVHSDDKEHATGGD